MAGETSSGAADRSNNTETGRIDDPWRRIETEKPQRDAARRAWDAEHDPAPEFEYAIRPLPDDYGKHRPPSRDLTEAQRQELADVFGRPTEELMALRDKDPRAGYNRDDQDRILDHDGNPRQEKTPEEILREAQRQADLYGPNATQSRQEKPGDAPDRQDREELSELLGTLVHDLRDGDLSNDQAAEHLETFRESIRPERIEVVPPDGKRLVVDIDEQGRADLSNPRVEDGASQVDHLQSTRRIAHEHGDRAAEPPEPAGDELSGDSERRDLKDSRPTSEQLMGVLYKSGDDLTDAVEAGGKTGQQIFEGPRDATAEVLLPQGEVIVVRPPPAHSDGGDMATAIAALGLMIGAAYVKSRSIREPKDQDS